MMLTNENFLIFAAKFYDNPNCSSMEEFNDDLARFKYIKRLFTKYREGGELKHRLILNHLVILFNLFGEGTTRMLFLKLDGQWDLLKPFLITLSRLPPTVEYVGNCVCINTNDIHSDLAAFNSLLSP